MSRAWPTVRLADLLIRSGEVATLNPEYQYQEVTVKLWGKGVVRRGDVTGAAMSGQRRFVIRAGQFILSRIDARNGALGMVPLELDGAVVSSDFPVFTVNEDRLSPTYLGWMCRTRDFVEVCRRASEGTTNRVRLQEPQFLATLVHLPPLAEQRRVVARIGELLGAIEEARSIRSDVQIDQERLLMGVYRRIVAGAPRRPLGDIAPLVRRPIAIDASVSYPQIAVRSFGRGTFHKPPLVGREVTWQKAFRVRAGDILISNIKAWEGAIAVASIDDDGRFGSHRYLTFVPRPTLATARFICFHLLTAEGLNQVGAASPGSADRNRTLGAEKLLRTSVPVPLFEEQLRFDQITLELDDMMRVQTKTRGELDALLPAILDRAFKGQLV